MQVILLERVSKLGQMGDVVDVKSGYARNYLLLQGKAMTASKENIAAFEEQKAQFEARNLESKQEADDLGNRLDGQKFIVIRQASDAGSLYGSVTPRDIAEVATAGGFSIDRKQVRLFKPIKELGLHEALVTLHPEVEVSVTLNVARSKEEANIQAQGKSIVELNAEAEAEAESELNEMLGDIGSAATDVDDSLAIIGSNDESETKDTQN